MDKRSLIGTTLKELTLFTEENSFSEIHNQSILNNIYKKRISSIEEFNSVPKSLRNLLNSHFKSGFLPPVTSAESADKTIKYLFRREDGSSYETVFLPGEKRTTVCVSTQSGCRMGCSLCVTASYGFRRDLTASEIVNQVISLHGAQMVNHIVLMGMGEPMDNLENVLRACDIFTAGWGLSISAKNITVSTVGIFDGVKKFLEESNCNLTLSLHSPFAEERKLLVPAEKKWPSADIINLIKGYPASKNRRFTVAYIMIKGLNDTDRHLEALVHMLSGSKIRVNILPYHDPGFGNYFSSSDERMQYFRHKLMISGVSASIRKSKGEDISAACGLLAKGLE